jgi:choline dehydrogenase-like flavoprotein
MRPIATMGRRCFPGDLPSASRPSASSTAAAVRRSNAARVTLAEDVDQYGLRIPRVTYSWCDNDRRLIDHSLKFMTQALEAVDARDIWTQDDDTCHLNGTARMGSDRDNSVVDSDCRSWDIPNLWICDGSVFPTVGGANPSLTIQAIACRTADRIRTLARRGELDPCAIASRERA